MKKLSLILLFILIWGGSINAQRERNYIYLVDCTSSMLGVSPNQLKDEMFNDETTLYHKTLEYLKEDIKRINNPATTITVIPFIEYPGEPIQFERSEFNWKEIENSFEVYVKKSMRTGICKAWDEGIKCIDKNKDNYFYLLTDGTENVDNGRSVSVINRIRQWCGKFDHSYGFYVALSDDALNKCPGLQEAVDLCDRMSIVSNHLGPFGCISNNTLTINTRQLKSKALSFSAEGTFSNINIKGNDPYIEVRVKDNQIKDGRFILEFSKKVDFEQPEYEFDVEVTSNPNELQIVKPIIHVKVVNKDMRNVDIPIEEFDGGKAKYYPSFLFSRAKEPDVLTIDLSAEWNDVAIKEGSTITMNINCDVLNASKGSKKYVITYNGEPVKDGIFVMRATDTASLLGISFDPSTKSGKYFFNLEKVRDENVETINSETSKTYNNQIRVRNAIVWNPLAKTLFIVLLVIVAGLILWFVILKRIFFPTFKVGKYQITEPYFVSRKLSGVRKVVFGNSKRSQGMLSALFTGKILYETNELWNYEWILTPSARKGARVNGISQHYDIDPYCSTMDVQTEYKIENLETKQKAIISLF